MVAEKTISLNDQWNGAQQPAALPADTHKLKVVFLAGGNSAAHGIIRKSVPELCELLRVEIHQTTMPKNKKLQEKLDLPENRRFSFYENLPGLVIYPIVEKLQRLKADQELDENLKYSPKELADYFLARGLDVHFKHVDNPNDPAYVGRMDSDPDILTVINTRSMHILKKPLIAAIESKTHLINGVNMQARILNTHPGQLPRYPGTHTVPWAMHRGERFLEWTLHVIDEHIDTGPILDTCAKPIAYGKTILQNLMGGVDRVAQMVVTDVRLRLQGRPRPAVPQNDALRPKENYTYLQHQQWLDLGKKGLRAVNPDGYIRSLTIEHTGDDGSRKNSPKLSKDVRRALEKAVADFEAQYVLDYQAVYGHPPARIYIPPASLTATTTADPDPAAP